MATKQVRICDRCGAPEAVTIVILLDGMPRKADLCPDCRDPIEDQWERMPRPTPRNTSRRLQVVSMETVQRARNATRGTRKQG